LSIEQINQINKCSVESSIEEDEGDDEEDEGDDEEDEGVDEEDEGKDESNFLQTIKKPEVYISLILILLLSVLALILFFEMKRKS
jgi:hypothetical protein